MAEEEKTTGTEETETLTEETGEEEGKVGSEESTEKEEGSKESATKPSDAPEGYEITYPDGIVEKLTVEQYNERLLNYPKLKTTLDRQSNELGELRKLKQPTPTQTVQAQQVVSESGRVEEFTEDEVENPNLREKLNRVVQRNIELEQKVQGFPTMADEAARKRQAEMELDRVIKTHPWLKTLKPKTARLTAILSAQHGDEINAEYGREVYGDGDLSACVDAYHDSILALTDQKRPMSQSSIIRELKKDSNEVLVSGGSKKIEDVVAKYNSLKTNQERAKYLDSLPEEAQNKIREEIYGTGE